MSIKHQERVSIRLRSVAPVEKSHEASSQIQSPSAEQETRYFKGRKLHAIAHINNSYTHPSKQDCGHLPKQMNTG